MKRWIYILLIPLLVACESEIHYSGKETNPGLVLEALPLAGSDTLVCYINRSHFIVDGSKTSPEELKDLSIDLSVSSGVCRIISDSVAGFIHHLKLSNPLPAGDTLRIAVSHPNYPTAVAEEFILPHFEPKIETIVKDTDIDGRMEYRLSVALPDYPYPDILVGILSTVHITQTYIGPHWDKESQTSAKASTPRMKFLRSRRTDITHTMALITRRRRATSIYKQAILLVGKRSLHSAQEFVANTKRKMQSSHW